MHLLETHSTLKLKRKPTDVEVGEVCSRFKKKIDQLARENPVASIVVPAFNEEMYILLMIQAMTGICTNHAIEFIGIDNGSSDRTAEIFQQSGFHTIKEKRKGTSYARQAGLEAAKGDFIFTTDADTLVPPTWIDTSLEYFSKDSDLVCLSGGAGSAWPGTVRLYSAIRQLLYQAQRISGKKSHQMDSFPGHNAVFKRKIAMQVGGYEPGSDMGEDNILARKMGEFGKLLRVNDNKKIQVKSSGRRTASLGLVIKMLMERKKYALTDNQSHPTGQTFTDIR